MSLKLGTTMIAGVPVGLINTVDEVSSKVNTKLDANLGNIPTASKQAMTTFAMPSSKYTDIAWSSGATYTAPADGWYVTWGGAGEGGNGLTNLDNHLSASSVGNSGNWNYLTTFVPAKKGQRVQTYHRGGSIDGFRFVYAEGAQ